MAVGNHATQQIDQKIDWAAMPGMLDLRDVLELIMMVSIIERFLSKRRSDNHQAVLHVRAQSGNQTNTEGIQQELEEGLGDITFVTKRFPEQLFDQLRDRFAVVHVAWRERQVEQFAAIIDKQGQFEAKEPTARTLASLSETRKYLVLLDAQIVTHHQGCGLDE